MFTFFGQKFKKEGKKREIRGFSKDPFFYFGVMSFVLFGFLFFSSPSLAEPNYSKNSDIIFFNSFFKNTDNLSSSDLFFSQNKELALETPDLKIIQDNSVYAVTTPTVLTTQTLGDIFGGTQETRKEVVDYVVAPGDTVKLLADKFGISENTIAWANNISKSSALKVGQNLVIMPFSGVLYVVKNGDTLSQIAKIYKPKTQDSATFIGNIIADNNLANEGDVFIGDILSLRDGVMPQKAVPLPTNVPLADNFFIFPAEGEITQGLHYYNAVDLANKCGTPIYAAAAGTVQRAVANGGYNLGMGNYVTLLHSNGTVTYYGHLMSVLVKPGDTVNVGDRIGLMGRTGNATGCHVHFEVIGAQNPLARYLMGAQIRYK